MTPTALSFTEDESFRLTLNEADEIIFSEFDRKFEHIFILKNQHISRNAL